MLGFTSHPHPETIAMVLLLHVSKSCSFCFWLVQISCLKVVSTSWAIYRICIILQWVKIQNRFLYCHLCAWMYLQYMPLSSDHSCPWCLIYYYKADIWLGLVSSPFKDISGSSLDIQAIPIIRLSTVLFFSLALFLLDINVMLFLLPLICGYWSNCQ